METYNNKGLNYYKWPLDWIKPKLKPEALTFLNVDPLALGERVWSHAEYRTHHLLVA